MEAGGKKSNRKQCPKDSPGDEPSKRDRAMTKVLS